MGCCRSRRGPRRGTAPTPRRRCGSYGSSSERRTWGFTLADVESLLRLAEGGPDSCDAVREMAAEKTADLDARIADLQAMRMALARLIETCGRPRNRRECPILAEVSGDPEEAGHDEAE